MLDLCPTTDNIFNRVIDPAIAGPFALSVGHAGVLRAISRRKNIWVLGASAFLKQETERLLTPVNALANQIKYVDMPLQDHGIAKIEKFLQKIDDGAMEANIIVIAEEAYGKAFDLLCRVLPSPMLTICPDGLLRVALKNARWPHCNYSMGASHFYNYEQAYAAVQDKKAVIYGADDLTVSRARLLFGQNGPEENILGFIPGASNKNHPLPDQEKLLEKTFLQSGDYDLIVTTRDHLVKDFDTINGLSKDYSLIFLLPEYKILHAAEIYFSHKLFSSAHLQKNYAALQAQDDENFKDYCELYKRCDFVSYEHFTQIKACADFIFKGRTYVNAPKKSRYVNVKDGFRHTEYQPDAFENVIYLYGESYTYGIGVDDEHTVASLLQKICHKEHTKNKKFPKYKIHNRGINCCDITNVYNLIQQSKLNKNDIVILQYSPCNFNKDLSLPVIKKIQSMCLANGAHFAVYLHPSIEVVSNPSDREGRIIEKINLKGGFLDKINYKLTIDYRNTCFDILKANGINVYDMQQYCDKPYKYGEIFYDHIHLTSFGNMYLAEVIYNSFIKHLANTDIFDVDQYALTAYINMVKRSLCSDTNLTNYITNIPKFTANSSATTGAIVMNCNPFTKGHLYLIEQALREVDRLYIFLVEEDKSFFSFHDRLAMVTEGTTAFGDRIKIVPSGRFIISSDTFPEYFNKDHIEYTPDATADLIIFGARIAPELGIDCRFLGEEPFCMVTRNYHLQTKQILPMLGIPCLEIPRLQHGETAISASRVRKLLKDGNFAELSEIVPISTLRHLKRFIKNDRPHTGP